ncbi:MAG: metallophosphoesterase [Gluconacetobacter diazotrophicus]|nr:metallophosphoesterase [Gluconacetobacter diazotrophicus]
MVLSFPTARDPLLSLFQSAAAVVARRDPVPPGTDPAAHPLRRAAGRLVDAARAVPSAASPDAVPPTGPDNHADDCAVLGLRYLRALVSGSEAARDEAADRLRFSRCDPFWAETLLDYARSLGPGGRVPPLPYVRYDRLDRFVLPVPSARCQIALLSDWGTGTVEARRVAALLAARRPDIVIHLGDIYYAGTPAECDAHFLRPLRAVLPADIPVLALCGNHDTYSGGAGYYGLLRTLNQPASYFCLRAPDRSWQILAADTGLHDRDPFTVDRVPTFLDPAEELWHADKLRGFPGRTVLLSHHQPFSAFSRIGPAADADPTNPHLMASHARLSAAGRIDAWFWGHEHTLRFYAPYRGVVRGRTVGFGAIPVAPGSVPALPDLRDPPGLALDLTLDVVDGAYTHGFTLLECSPAGIDAAYWCLSRPDGPFHRETVAP